MVIIGAGAAGLMCAIEAGKRGRRVLVLDKSAKVGEKIRISGGGRCNFTNLHATPKQYLSENPHFCVSALKRYMPADFIALVEKHGIAYHEKTLGQLFCDGSSKQIIAMLEQECAEVDVQFQLSADVQKIEKNDSGFVVHTHEATITAASVVIATGGPSIPKMGATGWGYEVAKQFGLNVIAPRAGLVPFTLADEALHALAGVSLEAVATCGKVSFREGMLFTHRGLSGPAILQISSYWREGEELHLNFAPDMDMLAHLKTLREQSPKQEIQTVLSALLPKKLAHYVCEQNGFAGKLAECSNASLQAIAAQVNDWTVVPNGTEGYRTAEVTLGGVDTDALSSKTMEAKQVSGLYFVGEVVDVTGWLGGYNFQWAWASGHAAGQFV